MREFENDQNEEFYTPDPDRSERVSIWSVKEEWIEAYYFAFFTIVLIFIYWRTLREFIWNNTDDVYSLDDRIMFILQDTAPAVIVAAVASMLLIRLVELILRVSTHITGGEQ